MSRSRRVELRKTETPLPTMTVSDFVRGGIYDVQEQTMILTHGEPLGTWIPRGQSATYYAANSTPTNSTTTATAGTTPATNYVFPVLSAANLANQPSNVDMDGIREAVAKLNAFLNAESEEDNDGQEEG